MIAHAQCEERIAKVAAICLALPRASRIDRGDHSIFRVAGRVFAYLLNNHHGDQIVSVACKVLPGDNQRLIDAEPGKFYLPAYVGPRGWIALRLDRASVDWSEAKEMLRGSYFLTAPKRRARIPDPVLPPSAR